eukprot:3044075-Amphidinium_carterae.1
MKAMAGTTLTDSGACRQQLRQSGASMWENEHDDMSAWLVPGRCRGLRNTVSCDDFWLMTLLPRC